MKTFDEILLLVAKIPKGKVTTYGEIAKAMHLRNPRIVGYALHGNKRPDEIPCHRVVNKNGGLAKGYAFGGTKIQKKLLEKEGVYFADEETVDMEKSFIRLIQENPQE